MSVLLTGIGADDMFQLLTEWRQSNIRDSTEDRMANTLRSTAVSLTITSLTDLIALCIGATSPFVSIRNFCAFSGKQTSTQPTGSVYENSPFKGGGLARFNLFIYIFYGVILAINVVSWFLFFLNQLFTFQ